MDNWQKIGKRYDFRFKKLSVLCEQQNYRCCYCGVAMIYPMSDRMRNLRGASIEHLKPVSKGGRGRYANLVAACQGCNTMRSSDIEALEFFEWRSRQTATSTKTLRKNLGQYRKSRALAEESVTPELLQRDGGTTDCSREEPSVGLRFAVLLPKIIQAFQLVRQGSLSHRINLRWGIVLRNLLSWLRRWRDWIGRRFKRTQQEFSYSHLFRLHLTWNRAGSFLQRVIDRCKWIERRVSYRIANR